MQLSHRKFQEPLELLQPTSKVPITLRTITALPSQGPPTTRTHSMTSFSSCLKQVSPSLQRGFTLVEIAMVLVIIGLLLGGVIAPLRTQRDVSQREATERQLQDIRAALIGFAQTNNRLPCPATPGTNGIESRVPLLPAIPTSGNCTAPLANSVVPYQVLGIQGVVINGTLVDAWLRPVRYRVTNPTMVAPNNWIYARGRIPIAPTAPALPNFQICPGTALCATPIAGSVVAVVFSTGKDGPDLPASVSPDQVTNLAGGNNFIMRTPTEYLRTGIEFDDIVVWISHPTLIYELGRAGRL